MYGKWDILSRETVLFSEGPLSEVPLYFSREAVLFLKGSRTYGSCPSYFHHATFWFYISIITHCRSCLLHMKKKPVGLTFEEEGCSCGEK